MTATAASRRSAVPADALASTARYLIKRGNIGAASAGATRCAATAARRQRSYAAWQAAGVRRANGEAFPLPNASARRWTPVPGGPSFLIGQNFVAVHSYNPSMNYTLAIVHLSDRLRGDGPFVQPFPGSERTPTLAELKNCNSD